MSKQQMPIFVISLPHAVKRREFIEQRMAEHELEFSFFDALDGQDLDVNFWTKSGFKEAQRIIERAVSQGELGCIFSHYQLLRKIVQERLTWAVVLEDDADISSRFVELVRNPALLSSDWDMLQVGYWARDKESRPVIWRYLYPLSLWHSKHLVLRGSKHYIGPFIDHTEGTHGYIANQKGANKIINLIEQGLPLPFDVFLNFHNDSILRYGISPSLVNQNDTAELEQHIEQGRAKKHAESNPNRGPIVTKTRFHLIKNPVTSFVMKHLRSLRVSLGKIRRIMFWRTGRKIF